MINQDLVIIENAVAEKSSETANLIQDWINHCDVSPLTQKSYDSAAKSFLAFLRENNLKLSEQSIINYREYLKQHFSTSTARLYFSICKTFCRWLAKRVGVADFATDIKNVKLDNSVHARDPLSIEEIATVINNISNLRDKCIVALMACCGLRTIEVVRLDCGDIEKRRGKYFLRIWGKARAGKVDSVCLPAELKQLIDEYLKSRGKVSAAEPLFVSASRRNKNSRLQTQSISRLAKRAMKAVGLNSRRLVAHSLRHSFANNALSAGVDIRQVSKAMRHKSQAVTEVYLHDADLLNNPAAEVVTRNLFSFVKG